MIFYITDNEVSQIVGKAFEKGGAEIEHVNKFWIDNSSHAMEGPIPIFYGILRGVGAALRTCQFLHHPYVYVDNGYFDAVYRDSTGHKEMTGNYRIVKNDLIEKYTGKPRKIEPRRPLKILALPPTPYSANMQDTTPEDWFLDLKKLRAVTKDHVDVRLKDEKKPLAEQLQSYDGVLAFNSMSVMEATKHGKAVWDFHGCFRNADRFTSEIPYYNYDELRAFYSTKQFTLEEVAEGNWQ